MSTTTTVEVVGTSRDRVDGRLKVMGAATYPIDVTLPGLAHAVLVQSTVTSGRIRHIAVDTAERAPGVLAVITHVNTPLLAHGPATEIGPQPLPPFQSDAVLHYGQHVAMVVAETREQANAAAAMIVATGARYRRLDAVGLSSSSPAACTTPRPSWRPERARVRLRWSRGAATPPDRLPCFLPMLEALALSSSDCGVPAAYMATFFTPSAALTMSDATTCGLDT